MSEDQIYGYKRVQGITFSFSRTRNFTPLHNGLIIMGSVYNVIKFFNTSYCKVPLYTVEVVISNQTELGARGGEFDRTTFLIAFLKTSILHDLRNFLLLKIYEKILAESSFET